MHRDLSVGWVSRISVSLLCAILAGSEVALADDWRQWMGPTGDGVYHEQGIIEAIPADGLKVKWRREIAGGYASPTVAAGRVYLFDYVIESGQTSNVNDPDKRAELDGSERLTCFDAATGEPIWTYSYHCPYSISYPAGPRCAPTVDIQGPGDPGRVYALGSQGDLTCLDATRGDVIWRKNFPRDYQAEVPVWGFAAHPLVDGDLVYCMVGGRGQTVVAFDKMTGEERWSALSAKHVGYCPPSIIESAGVRQLVVWHGEAIVGLDPLTGNEHWSLPIEPDFAMSITRPQREGNRVYASGIRTEAVMFSLDQDQPAITELWRGGPKDAVHCANSTPIFHDGVIYGTDCNEGALLAIDADTGKRLWKTFAPTQPDEKRFVRHGTAFLARIANTDRYFLMSETGDLILARLTARQYEELGRFHVLEPTSEAFGRAVVWSYPAYAYQTAFVRNDKELVAVSLAAD